MIRLILIPWMLLLWWLPPETHGYSLAVAGWIAVLFAWLLPVARPIAAAVGSFLAIACVWQLGAANPALALPSSATLCLAVLLFALSVWGRDAPSLESLLPGIRIGVAGVALWAIYQKLFGLKLLAAQVATMESLPDQTRILERIEEGRAFAGFITPAALGGFLALWIPLLVWDAWRHRSSPAAVAWRASLLAAVMVAFLFASSVTATLALLGCVAVLVLRRAMRDRRAVWAVAILSLLLISMVGLRGSDILNPNAKRGPIGLRLGNFRAATELVLRRPLLGYGAGGFAENYPSVRREGENETRHVHNLPLEWMVEWGAPLGGIASVGFLGCFLMPLWLRRSSRDESHSGDKGLELALAVGCASFALQNLLDFTSMLPSLLWTASWLAGIVWRQRLAPALAPTRSSRGALNPVAIGLALAAILPALALSGTGVGREAVREARSAFASRDFEGARAYATRALQIAPWLPEPNFVRAESWIAQGQEATEQQLDRALRDVSRGIRLAPQRPRGFRLRANLRARRGDLPGAGADLDSAMSLYPFDVSLQAERDAVDKLLSSWGP